MPSWASSQGAGIRITHLYDNSYKIEAACVEKRDLLPWVLACAQGRSEISNVKLFKRLKENSITGIYFGSRASEENILRARDKIEKSSMFGQSVTFHRSIESQDRFEINFEKL